MRHPTPAYELVWPGKIRRVPPSAPPLLHTDSFNLARIGAGSGRLAFGGEAPPLAEGPHRLCHGDNLAVMAALLPEFRGRIDFLYLDPPYEARRNFHAQLPVGDGGEELSVEAYRDTWGEGESSYLQHLYDRLPLIRELLSPTGSLVVHVDWRASHLVRVLLDEVFGTGERDGPGRPGFRNEIVWGYGGGGAVRTAYRRKHDTLLWYTRSDKWTFNPQYRPYSEKTRQRGLTAVKGPRYSLREEGASLESWWTDEGVQKILSPTAMENWKYPTQKPESLLERLIQGHSHPGDLVADFYCGSGTTAAVAERLGRRWLVADEGALAVRTTWKRLTELQAALYEQDGTPRASVELLRTASAPTTELAFRARVEEGRVTVEVMPGQGLADGRPGTWDLVDGWAIDPDHGTDGGTFRPRWSAHRTPKRRALPNVSPVLIKDGASPERAAVQVTDLWGREARLRVEA